MAKYVVSPAVGAIDTASRKVPKIAGAICGLLGHDPIKRVGAVNTIDLNVVTGEWREHRAAIDQCTRCRKRRIDTPYLGKVWTA